MILDDIWDPWVLKAFDNQCQILLTTRDKSVTDSVMGKYYFLFNDDSITFKYVAYQIAYCVLVILQVLNM